jgi:leucyl-tRNA synthetase
MTYGDGAVMGVPAHDERDFAFAKKYAISIKPVIDLGKPYTLDEWQTHYGDHGVCVNSGPMNGMTFGQAIDYVAAQTKGNGGEKKVTWRLRDWGISRQRYWGTPIPIIHCADCGAVPVPEKDLPVVLPEDLIPDGSGSPLKKDKRFLDCTCPQCGKPAQRETDTMDTFVDSSWYFMRYCSPDASTMVDARNDYWMPMDQYIGGIEHAVLHLLYARFITMVMKDGGFIDFEEPFTRFRAHGMIIREGAKMSKSKGNVINPDVYMEEWGADAFRMYLMFLGPYEEGGDFRDQGISGVRRFLDRLWASVRDARTDGAPDADVLRKMHRTIKKVGEDTANLGYNTAIAAMMEYMNAVRRGERTPHRDEVLPLVQLAAPFAPHLAEECWEALGHTGSVFDAGWPSFDPAMLVDDEVDLVVQVNGKVRGKLRVPVAITQDDALALARADEGIAKFLTGEFKKVVFVPKRLLNIVV